MQNTFSAIIALNTLLKYVDWFLLIIGIFLLVYTNDGNILGAVISTITALIIIIWLGRFVASLLVLISSLPLFITTFLTNRILNRYNNENLTNDLTIFQFIMIAFSMLCYGWILVWIFLSQNYNNPQDFYYGLLFLYIAIIYPAMLIDDNQEHAFDIFGGVWTFFYRISFAIGIISIALFNISVYSILIVTITGMMIPVNMLYSYIERGKNNGN